MDDSVISRLLDELSWEGKRVRFLRDGARGRESVLSAQVLQALNFLPRQAFLGEVLDRAHGADTARAKVAAEVEDLTIDFLPGDTVLSPTVNVQPDAWLVGVTTLTLVEAKGPGRSTFNRDQLGREYRTLLQERGDRTPLFFLILPAPPPLRVEGIAGTVDPAALLTQELPRHLMPDGSPFPLDQVFRTLAWITWDEIATTVTTVMERFTAVDPSVTASVNRVADSLVEAVRWHRPG